MKKLFNIILVVSFLLTMTTGVFAVENNDEAVYNKLEKSYILNNDGSQQMHFSMELTLFTHPGISSNGETFIEYNPEFQTLKINTSYTKQKDGTIIKTPENAFVEVLPHNAANAPEFNNLKEMVVVHTGLELGCTVYLDYTLTSKPGYLPELDVFENIRQSWPVNDYTLLIAAPESKTIHFDAQHLNIQPSESSKNGLKQYTWHLTNLPCSALEYYTSYDGNNNPYITATTYSNEAAALSTLYKQFDSPSDAQLQTLAETLTEGKNNDAAKIEALHRYVMSNIDNSALTLTETGNKLRSADKLITTAYGTEAEKVNLLTTLLKAVEINAEPAAVFIAKANDGCLGLKAIKQLLVIAKADGKEYYLSPNSTRRMFAQNSPVFSIATGKEITLNLPDSKIAQKGTITFTADTARLNLVSESSEAYIPYFSTPNNSIKRDMPLKFDNGFATFEIPISQWSLANSLYPTLGSIRTSDLQMPSVVNEQYSYTLQIPSEYQIVSAPNKSIKNSAGELISTVKNDGGSATVTLSLVLAKGKYSPAEYPALRELLTEWGNVNARTIVLKK